MCRMDSPKAGYSPRSGTYNEIYASVMATEML